MGYGGTSIHKRQKICVILSTPLVVHELLTLVPYSPISQQLIGVLINVLCNGQKEFTGDLSGWIQSRIYGLC